MFGEHLSGRPDGSVVGEVDHPRIEPLEGVNPRRDTRERLAVIVAAGSPRELVCCVLRRRSPPPAIPARKLSGVRSSQRSMNNAC